MKGQATLEIVTVILLLIVFAITAVVMAQIVKPVNEAFQEEESFSNFTKSVSSVNTSGFLTSTNNITPMIVMILWMAALVSAFLIDTHPVFVAITIVLIIFLVLFAAIVANVYDDATVSLDRSDYDITSYIFENLVGISLAMAASVVIVLFARSRGGIGV